jgi:uncharacterized membrane protein
MEQNSKNIFRIILGLISLAGTFIMGYLVYLHYHVGAESFCNLGEGLSCELVNQSLYSEVLGIPVSIMGVIYFSVIFLLVLLRYSEKTLKQIAFVTIVFLGPSIYLTLTEIFIIKSICVLCETSKVLMLVIIGVIVYALKPVSLSKNLVIGGLILAVLSGGTTYYIHASAVPEGTYDIFAQCLYDEGMRMYGSEGCSFCAKQRGLFGSAIEFVNEIECDPRYEGYEVERCVSKQIEHTPTWILEDENGEDVVRLEPGVQSLEKLSEVSGCAIEE